MGFRVIAILVLVLLNLLVFPLFIGAHYYLLKFRIKFLLLYISNYQFSQFYFLLRWKVNYRILEKILVTEYEITADYPGRFRKGKG